MKHLRTKILITLIPILILTVFFGSYYILREINDILTEFEKISLSKNALPSKADTGFFNPIQRLASHDFLWGKTKHLIFASFFLMFLLAWCFLAVFEEVINRPLSLFHHELAHWKKKESIQNMRFLQSNDEIGEVIKQFVHLMQQVEALSKVKDEFLAICSHDLRAPIGFIRSSTQILIEGHFGPLPDLHQETVERMYHRAGDALNLIDDLLDLGRMESGLKLNYQDFALSSLLHKCVESVSFGCQAKGIDIKYICSDSLRITADQDRLEQLISNLISNAVKFVPENTGRIVVEAQSNFPHDKPVSSIENPTVSVSVVDNGRGIPPHKLKTVFKRYEQSEQADAKIGYGIGLSIVQKVIDLHHGHIKVESELGKGTTFTCQLPLTPPG